MVSQLGEERGGMPDLPTMSSAADVTARLSRGLTLDKMMMIDDVLHPTSDVSYAISPLQRSHLTSVLG